MTNYCDRTHAMSRLTNAVQYVTAYFPMDEENGPPRNVLSDAGRADIYNAGLGRPFPEITLEERQQLYDDVVARQWSHQGTSPSKEDLDETIELSKPTKINGVTVHYPLPGILLHNCRE